MVLGENRGDGVARGALGNRNGNLLTSGDACVLPASRPLTAGTAKKAITARTITATTVPIIIGTGELFFWAPRRACVL